MKKAIAAMLVMFVIMVLLGGVWSIILKPVVGGGVDQSYIYPIYGGLIVLAGLVVGAAAVVYEEIHKLREEIKSIREDAEKSKQE